MDVQPHCCLLSHSSHKSWVSLLVPSLQSVCSEKSHCLPSTAESSMAEPNSHYSETSTKLMQQLTAEQLPVLMLTVGRTFSQPSAYFACPPFITWIFISNPSWDSREHELPFPIQLSLARCDTYLQESFSISSMACLQFLWTRAMEEPCRIRSYLVGFARDYQCFATALQK